ncbi:hypothetical protein ACHHYP_11702 [Achlya hypogyna]|uniref:Uncharacterized protein n=1 Tax=Achlya hypogyna TaxID=1202772 RepID=A0A1V9ZHE9_ACHHY|nr:hypothetical protein ACHHYP_11702 [Achlya hypogyna]
MVVHGLSLGTSLRSLAECMDGWMSIAGYADLGKPNQRDIGTYVRQLVAINYSAFEKLLNSSWCFAIGVDGASHGSEGYLDVSICFPVHDTYYQFRTKLSALVAFTRKHTNLSAAIGNPATFSETRWDSIVATCTVAKEEVMPESEWWLCLYAIETITDKICMAFKKCSYQIITPREQLTILRDICYTLLLTSQRQAHGDGEITFRDIKLEYLVIGDDVDVWATFHCTDEYIRAALLKTLAKAIDVFALGINIICTNATDIPRLPQTPEELVNFDINVFMTGVERHRMQLTAFGGVDMVKAIPRERKRLLQTYVSDINVQRDIKSMRGATLAAAWASSVDMYPILAAFCTGLATVSPATHSVESDVSILKNTKNDNRRALSNYAIEGHMQAKQFKLISAAVTSAKLMQDRIRKSASTVVA